MHLVLKIVLGLFALNHPAYGNHILESFDPVLDAPEDKPSRGQRIAPLSAAGLGLGLGPQVGIYGGQTSTYVREDVLQLRSGWHPSFGVHLSYRTAGALEIVGELNLGLGKRLDTDTPAGRPTLDLLLEPSIQAHWYEAWPISLYAGLGLFFCFFDLADGGESQSVIGPSITLGALWRSDEHSALVIQVGSVLAYNSDAVIPSPTEGEMNASGNASEASSEEGQWLSIFRFTLGYRLTAF